MSQGALFALLALSAGRAWRGRSSSGANAARRAPPERATIAGAVGRDSPRALLKDLALVIALAAVLAAL